MMGTTRHSATKTSTALGAWMATDLEAHMASTGTSTDMGAHMATEALGTCTAAEAWMFTGATMGMGTSSILGMATPSFLNLATDTAIEAAIYAEPAER